MSRHKEWLTKALGDLKSCKKLIKDDDETLDGVAYHAQQCAEKAIKAFIILSRNSVTKTHDLEKLVVECISYDATFKVILDDAINLNPYSHVFRYPDDRFSIDREEALLAVQRTERILSFVQKRINEVLHPNMKLFD